MQGIYTYGSHPVTRSRSYIPYRSYRPYKLRNISAPRDTGHELWELSDLISGNVAKYLAGRCTHAINIKSHVAMVLTKHYLTVHYHVAGVTQFLSLAHVRSPPLFSSRPPSCTIAVAENQNQIKSKSKSNRNLNLELNPISES